MRRKLLDSLAFKSGFDSNMSSILWYLLATLRFENFKDKTYSLREARLVKCTVEALQPTPQPGCVDQVLVELNGLHWRPWSVQWQRQPPHFPQRLQCQACSIALSLRLLGLSSSSFPVLTPFWTNERERTRIRRKASIWTVGYGEFERRCWEGIDLISYCISYVKGMSWLKTYSFFRHVIVVTSNSRESVTFTKVQSLFFW